MIKFRKSLIYIILLQFKSCLAGLQRYFIGWFFQAREAVRDYYRDQEQGGLETHGYLAPKQQISFFKDANPYQPLPYSQVEAILRAAGLTSEDVFVDLGCGKGRVIFYAARQGVKRVIGVEIDPKFVRIAWENLARMKPNHAPVEIIEQDVVNFDPKTGTVFYMYNPFGQESIAAVIKNIKESWLDNPRDIRILYVGGAGIKLLDDEPWLSRETSPQNPGCLFWRSRLTSEMTALGSRDNL